MTIERITRVKAESLVLQMRGLGAVLPLLGENAEFYLICEDSFLCVDFTLAVVEDGEITYISRENRRGDLEAFLGQSDTLSV